MCRRSRVTQVWSIRRFWGWVVQYHTALWAACCCTAHPDTGSKSRQTVTFLINYNAASEHIIQLRPFNPTTVLAIRTKTPNISNKASQLRWYLGKRLDSVEIQKLNKTCLRTTNMLFLCCGFTVWACPLSSSSSWNQSIYENAFKNR